MQYSPELISSTRIFHEYFPSINGLFTLTFYAMLQPIFFTVFPLSEICMLSPLSKSDQTQSIVGGSACMSTVVYYMSNFFDMKFARRSIILSTLLFRSYTKLSVFCQDSKFSLKLAILARIVSSICIVFSFKVSNTLSSYKFNVCLISSTFNFKSVRYFLTDSR